MSPRARLSMFLLAAAGLLALLSAALIALPPFGQYPGPYGDLINAAVVPERHATNAVSAVTFDYRGFDTLGEEFILFAAVTGVLLILRGERESEKSEAKGKPGRVRVERSEAIRWMSTGFIGVTIVFALALVLHAHLTPGGGFQGGAVLGTASMLVYLAIDYRVFKRVTPKSLLEMIEAAGAGTYVLIGLAGLCAGGEFLQNVLPLGRTGELLSAGTIPLINAAVGLEVAAGFAQLFVEFLKEVRTDAGP